MVPVRVIAAGGATLRGPVSVKLTREQWAKRVHVLGAVPKRMKAVEIGGGQALSFKYGEEFEVEAFDGRLNAALFEDLSEPPAESAEDGAGAAEAGEGGGPAAAAEGGDTSDAAEDGDDE